MYVNLMILAAFIFFYSVSSGWFERTPTSGAIVFTAFGLAFGPLGLDYLELDIGDEGLSTLAGLTLAMVLFTDAANANLGVLKQSFHIPQRLLLIGLPLTILLGFGVGILIFDDLTLLEIAILATMLAPTDAALGKAVVTNELVPSNVREGLNVESGLNDGICVPILFLFLALIAHSSGDENTSELAIKLVVEEIGIGVAVALLLTVSGTLLIKQCVARGWVSETWRQLPVITLAVACFAVAQSLGGSGFIAAFTGGLLFGGIAEKYTSKHTFLLAAEGTGDTMALITWVIFGAVVLGQSVESFSWQIVLYALLSLTVVRMLPVFLTLAGMNLRIDEKLFMGWFGPRGLASVVFAVIVLNANLPGGNTIVMTAVCTIILSIIAHGISANFLIAKLANRIRGSQGESVVEKEN
ncbi:MAG: sodium:proton antiporter [Gammaproteobacteria bacterium]|nr:MAG: sodium:proton antiporter [Gammaproteobacteria bacterium]